MAVEQAYREGFGGRARSVPSRHRQTIIDMLNNRQGPIRWLDFREAGVDYNALRDMVREGTLLYPAFGVFALPQAYDPHLLALATLSAHGTEFFACLETAAAIHKLLPESDRYLWLVLPNSRNTLRDVVGFEPIPVRWNAMRIPPHGVDITDAVRHELGWKPKMSRSELVERYYGIYEATIYGSPVKITSPARTVCDLLMFKKKPIAREGLNGLFITEQDAYDAVLKYIGGHEIDDAIEMANRMNYGREVTDYLSFAARISSVPKR